ncbi:MAG TPA: helix-turn-helix transcriptional regulator, partial [Gemmatimonadaceae bacterium]|nr:helix-turn-helix transcriptional regulator [Gemmatimonadaceae bacterium]
MPRPATDLLRGTLDLLILKSLTAAPMHGWALGQRIQRQSDDLLRVGQGSLYPALQRLEQQGWIESEWRAPEQNRP